MIDLNRFNPETLAELSNGLSDASTLGWISRCLYGLAEDIHHITGAIGDVLHWLMPATRLLIAVVKNSYDVLKALEEDEETIKKNALQHLTVQQQTSWDARLFSHSRSRQWRIGKCLCTIGLTSIAVAASALSIPISTALTALDVIEAALELRVLHKRAATIDAKHNPWQGYDKTKQQALADAQCYYRDKIQSKEKVLMAEVVACVGLTMLLIPPLHTLGIVLLLGAGLYLFHHAYTQRKKHSKACPSIELDGVELKPVRADVADEPPQSKHPTVPTTYSQRELKSQAALISRLNRKLNHKVQQFASQALATLAQVK